MVSFFELATKLRSASYARQADSHESSLRYALAGRLKETEVRGRRSEVGGQKIIIASRKEPNVDGLVKSRKIPFSAYYFAVLITF